MPDPRHPLLTVQDLNISFGRARVIEGVSFELGEGEILALIGPNGAGKTTLMLALLGLLPAEGQIRWHEKVKIGYLPQRLDFDRQFPITVRELFSLKLPSLISLGKGQSGMIREALKKVGAQKLLTRTLGELSGGELQRVLLAFALFGDPDVLCLDEPGTGIDVGGGETMYGLLHDLAVTHKLTAIIISHDLDVVYRYADQVLCINKTMLCHGVPRETLTPEALSKMYGTHVGAFPHGAAHHY